MKRSEILHQIITEQVFGRVVAHVCVKEFQKRSLDHSHAVFILYESFKSALRYPESINKLISAEIKREDDSHLQ